MTLPRKLCDDERIASSQPENAMERSHGENKRVSHYRKLVLKVGLWRFVRDCSTSSIITIAITMTAIEEREPRKCWTRSLHRVAYQRYTPPCLLLGRCR